LTLLAAIDHPQSPFTSQVRGGDASLRLKPFNSNLYTDLYRPRMQWNWMDREMPELFSCC